MLPDADAAATERLRVVADRYVLQRRIATGGMGEVYEARDTRLGRRVAIKFPRADRLGDARFLARLEKEASAIAALECEHCVSILDVSVAAECPFIVMEYVRGENLRELIDREGCLPVPRAAAIVQQAAVALEAAHSAGVIHRDLKPENVMISKLPYVGDWVKVLDFGIARIADSPGVSTTGAVVGTPYYMAPEQARGDSDLDARVDVYALSALLFELLAGERAHTGCSYNEVMYRVLTQNVPSLTSLRPNLPLGLCKLVEKGMAKDRDRRFESSAALAVALEPYARRGQAAVVDTGMQTVIDNPSKPAHQRRNSRGYLAPALCGCVVLGAGYWMALGTGQAEKRTPSQPPSQEFVSLASGLDEPLPDSRVEPITPPAAAATASALDVHAERTAEQASSATTRQRAKATAQKTVVKGPPPKPELPVPTGFEPNPYDD